MYMSNTHTHTHTHTDALEAPQPPAPHAHASRLAYSTLRGAASDKGPRRTPR